MGHKFTWKRATKLWYWKSLVVCGIFGHRVNLSVDKWCGRCGLAYEEFVKNPPESVTTDLRKQLKASQEREAGLVRTLEKIKAVDNTCTCEHFSHFCMQPQAIATEALSENKKALDK